MVKPLRTVTQATLLTFFLVLVSTTLSLPPQAVPGSVVNAPAPSPQVSPSLQPQPPPSPPKKPTPFERAASHSTPSDCWVVYKGNVYNVTTYLKIHPGGSQAITPYCGGDITHAFDSKDKSPPQKHSQAALQILLSFFIQ